MGGGGAEGERQVLVVPCLDPVPCRRRHEMASLPIPDELLADIFLRLPTPADLARASAVCVSFRRVAAGRSLLRRYRKLHAPPLLGFLDRHKVFYPATTPYPSASAAGADDLAADFSLSFLPAPASDWVLQDICDGRVLLDRRMRVHNSTVVFPEVVVCDPVLRRYLLIPPITYDLAALVEDPILTKIRWLRGEIFLDPTSYGEEAASADETSFRVIRMVQCKTKLVAFVFSSNTGQWRTLASRHWSDLFAALPHLTMTILLYSRHYAYGCFYWLTADGEESKLLVLDTQKMEFSLAEAPREINRYCNFEMVEAGEGRLGMFMLADSGSDLSYFIRQNDGGSQWIKVKTISLDSWAQFICSMENYLLLYQGQTSLLEPGCFTLDIKTFELEKVCTLGSTFYLRAYSNFPPSLLSSPTISSAGRRLYCKLKRRASIVRVGLARMLEMGSVVILERLVMLVMQLDS